MRLRLDPTSPNGVSYAPESVPVRTIPKSQGHGYVTNNIARLLTAGTNVTITGNGTESSPYNISATGGGTGGGSVSAWGDLTGTLSDQTDLQTALNNLVPYTGATTDIDFGNHDIKLTNVRGTASGTPLQLIAHAQDVTDTNGDGVDIHGANALGTANAGWVSLYGGNADIDGLGGNIYLSPGNGAGSGADGVTQTAHDIEITDSTKGVILTSPDASRWRLTVDNAGLLSTTEI